MPGVSGSRRRRPSLPPRLCGVSRKLNHSNSSPPSAAKPELLGAREHALQHWRGQTASGVPSASDEVAEEERHVVVPRDVAVRSPRSSARARRESRVPAGERGVVVAVVVRCPSRTRRCRSRSPPSAAPRELVLVEVLAAQDAVDVGDGDLDLAGCRSCGSRQGPDARPAGCVGPGDEIRVRFADFDVMLEPCSAFRFSQCPSFPADLPLRCLPARRTDEAPIG